MKNRSLPWGELVSTTDATSFYSPKPENFNKNVADLDLLLGAHEQGDLNLVSKSWVGSIAKVERNLLILMSRPGDKGNKSWYRVL